MKTLFLTLALAASAQAAPGPEAKKRLPLDCANVASIRDFKAAVVEDSGWEHKLAENWARYACPKEADEAGWSEPKPQLPEKWRGALPSRAKNPDDEAGNIRSLVDGFLLYPKRPLPITRKQAEQIAAGWHKQRLAAVKDALKKP